MSKKVHGSYFLDGRTGQTFITDDRDAGTDIGFRLTHDDVTGRVDRGGYWSDTAGGARAAYRRWNDPGDRFVNLGLRLCADWRDT